jgi:general secretion pathway protein L
MPTLSSDARFLGVDLGALWREIRRPWSHLHEWPVVSWLTPPAPIRLLQADGGESVWLGEQRQASAKPGKQPFVAVELPLDDVLCRSLLLPQVPDDELAGAIALEAQGASPFAAADLVWGSRVSTREGGGREAQIVLASRRQIEQYLASQAAPDAGATAELWVRIDAAAPVVLAGYGEGARVRFATRRRRWAYGLLVSAALLGMASAVTPVLQLRMRALEADRAYEDALQRTKDWSSSAKPCCKAPSR